MRIKYLVTATTGSLVTNLKILRRYLDALFRHLTWKKLVNILKVELAYYRQKPALNAYPYVLKIESTNICNLRCPFCLDRDRSAFEEGRGFGRMSLDQFKKIVDVLGPYTIRINLYGSGEPVLFPEIYDMISYASSKNIAVAISANLSGFKPENVDKLLTCGLEHLIISCHGATPESYAKYNVGGNFERVMESMRLLARRRKELKQRTPFLDWQFLLFSHNEHEKPLAKKLAKEIGVDIIRFVLPNIPPEHKKEWRPGQRKEEAKAFEQSGEDEGSGKTAPKKPVPIKVHRCSWLYRSIFFNWDGGVLPCCHEQIYAENDFGHADDVANFPELWNNDRYRQARNIANFKLHPEMAPIPMSCIECPMPKIPFLLHERGFLLPAKALKKIKPLIDEKELSGKNESTG